MTGNWQTVFKYVLGHVERSYVGELIDVRNPEEYAREHLPGARNIPLDQVVVRLTGAQERAYIFYCQSGLRSQRAAQTLKRRGLGKVYNLGAMARWDETPEVNAMVEPREANRPA
ncbi:MAG TPA: rhodanese-like domain-containing protein [Acidobacteria bacterium]|nr:rhodanese-like domain-containing protein [Acidobacteriota bacterium]